MKKEWKKAMVWDGVLGVKDDDTSSDLDSFHTSFVGDYKPTIKNKDTSKEDIIPYEKFEETHKKMLSKNDEAEMVLYNVYSSSVRNTKSTYRLSNTSCTRNHSKLRTSSNPRNHATIQDGRVTVQQVQGRQGQSYSGTGYKSNATSSGGNNASGHARVVKCYNCQGEGHMARQCTQPKRPRNATWYKDKTMLAEAQEAGQILDEEQLAFLADLGVPDGQAVQTIIPNNAAFQTEDLDTYDSNCDDISNAKVVLMANIYNYGSDIISEDFEQPPAVDFTDNEIHKQMSEQMINHVNIWEKANKEQNSESVTAELERYKERVKTFEQRLNIDLSSREKMIDSQMDDMIKEKLALKEQVDSFEQNLSKQIKETECLLQTFTVFKS
ncbi:integrase, catalytic region, zinc finger, CCHC-type containing protein [Tanacetum coccineum]